MRSRIGLVLIVLGGMLGYFGIQEWRLGSAASATPEEISLKDLLARGTEGNSYITLKDFGYCENFIYQTKKNRSDWTGIWIPVVPEDQKSRRGPPGGPMPAQTNVQALVTNNRVKNQSDLDKFCHLPTLEGMVINKIESLSTEQKNKLKESYPGTDFDRCLIIEAGRQPASSQKVMGFLAGSVVLLLAGAGVLLWAWKG